MLFMFIKLDEPEKKEKPISVEIIEKEKETPPPPQVRPTPAPPVPRPQPQPESEPEKEIVKVTPDDKAPAKSAEKPKTGAAKDQQRKSEQPGNASKACNGLALRQNPDFGQHQSGKIAAAPKTADSTAIARCPIISATNGAITNRMVSGGQRRAAQCEGEGGEHSPRNHQKRRGKFVQRAVSAKQEPA
ncbi:MAG: hypothetical protein LRY51_07820 [Geovibrio sp.]|nr:hypothetical protein [Geovibrio sp.]